MSFRFIEDHRDTYPVRLMWAMRDHMRVELVSSVLTMAVQQQRPEAGLIHHSDRGVLYASYDYRAVLSAADITASMSRKADCYDNAPMESFFHTLKTELVHHRQYQTRAEAQRDIFAFIEGFYNRTRLHSAIGYVAPIEMELKAAYGAFSKGKRCAGRIKSRNVAAEHETGNARRGVRLLQHPGRRGNSCCAEAGAHIP